MNLFSVFKKIDERENQIVIRSSTWPRTISSAGLSIAIVSASVLGFTTGSTFEALVWWTAGGTVLAIAGLMLAGVLPRTTIDFQRECITVGKTPYSFSDLKYVAMTEHTHVRYEYSEFYITFGFGQDEPQKSRTRPDENIARSAGFDEVGGLGDALHNLDETQIHADAMRANLRMGWLGFETVEVAKDHRYSVTWRTSHRIAQHAGAAVVAVTRNGLTTVQAGEVELSLVERLKAGTPEAATETYHVVSVEQEGGAVILTWRYSVVVPLALATLVITAVITLAALLSGMSLLEFGVFAGVLTAPLVVWFATLAGKYRLVLRGDVVEYRPPFGQVNQTISVGELYEAIVCPNRRQARLSRLLLVTARGRVLIRGDLNALIEVNLALREHLQRRSGDQSQAGWRAEC